MTRRERILATVNHQRPDRIPTAVTGRPEVNRDLMAHFGVDNMGEVSRILGADGWGGAGLAIDFPDFKRRVNGTIEGDFPYAGADMILQDSITFEDEWGVVRRVGSNGKYVEWVTGPLANAEHPDEWDFPTVDRIIDDGTLAARVKELKEQDLFVGGGCSMPFKTAWELRGLENLLADYVTNPEFVEKLYDKIFELYGEILARLVEAGVDHVGFGGDIAMQDRIIMGPDRWRAIDKPRIKAVFDRCRAINPDIHLKIHSDGNLWAIMEDLIEIGFDIIDPIQPECMDPVEVKKAYGDRIVLHGCGSIQHTLPFGSVDDVRAEASRLVSECGYNGGLVIRASNVIGYDCPLENVLTFFETVRDWEW